MLFAPRSLLSKTHNFLRDNIKLLTLLNNHPYLNHVKTVFTLLLTSDGCTYLTVLVHNTYPCALWPSCWEWHSVILTTRHLQNRIKQSQYWILGFSRWIEISKASRKSIQNNFGPDSNWSVHNNWSKIRKKRHFPCTISQRLQSCHAWTYRHFDYLPNYSQIC